MNRPLPSRTRCQGARPGLRRVGIVAQRRAARDARVRVRVPRDPGGDVLDHCLAVRVGRGRGCERVEPARDDPRVGQRVVPRIDGQRIQRRIGREVLPLRRVRQRRLRARRVVDRDRAVIGRRIGLVGVERANLDVVGAVRNAAAGLVVDRLRAEEDVRTRDIGPGRMLKMEDDVVRGQIRAGSDVDRLRAGRHVRAVERTAGRRGVRTAERVSRRELLRPVLAEPDLAGDGVDEVRVGRHRAALDVEDDRLVRGSHALGVRRKRDEPGALILREPGDLEAGPAVVAFRLREHVGRGDHAPEVVCGLEPRVDRRELRGFGRVAVTRRGRRGVGDVAVDDADGDHPVLRGSETSEALAEDDRMAVAADHGRVVQELEVGDSRLREPEEPPIRADEAARGGDRIVAEPGREVAAVLD